MLWWRWFFVVVVGGASLQGVVEVGPDGTLEERTQTTVLDDEIIPPDHNNNEARSTESVLARLMDEEVATLEKSIAYQQKKLEILAALRGAVVAEATASDDERLSTKYCVALSRAAERLDCGGGGAVVKGASPRRVEKARHEEGVVEKARVAAASVVAVELLSFRARGAAHRSARGQRQRPSYGLVHLVAIGFANGTVAVLDGVGEPVARFEARAAVAEFAFDGADSIEPALATGLVDGSIALYDLALWRDDVVVAGRRPRGTNLTTTHSALTSLRLSVREGFSFGFGGDIAALGVLSRRAPSGREVKFLSVATGPRLDLLHANGTRRASTTFDAQITSVERSGGTLAVAHGSTVSLLAASKWHVVGACRGADRATAIAFDAATPTSLHVAYASGDMLVFNTRARAPGSDKPVCKLQHNLGRPHPGPVLGLSVSRGFLASFSRTLLVHNTTHLASRSPRLVWQQQPKLAAAAAENVSVVRFAGAAAAPPYAVSSASEVVFAFHADDTLVLLESLFRFEPPLDQDISWMRMPILFIGLVVVFGYQIMRKQKSIGPSAYGGGGPAADHRGLDPAFLRDLDQVTAGGSLSHRRRRRSRRLDDDDDDDD